MESALWANLQIPVSLYRKDGFSNSDTTAATVSVLHQWCWRQRWEVKPSFSISRGTKWSYSRSQVSHSCPQREELRQQHENCSSLEQQKALQMVWCFQSCLCSCCWENMETSPQLQDAGIPQFLREWELPAFNFLFSLLFELPKTYVSNKTSLPCDQSLYSGFIALSN